MNIVKLGLGVISMIGILTTAEAQQNLDYAGNWACSFVQQYKSVDTKNWDIIKLSKTTIQYPGNPKQTRFTPKSTKKNVYRINYEDGVLEQFTILDTWIMLKENSEQTQVCLRQED